ncbi:MAG: hypothetical protein PHF17_08520 [Arcobacteraceae bacterium]|nr:hypothetical protein [Arcobacteraceae bacterium]
MFEYQSVSSKDLLKLYEYLSFAIENKKQILIIKAVEYAIRKELPNAKKYLITPIIRKLSKTLTIIDSYRLKAFSSEDEAKRLFEKLYGELLYTTPENEDDKKFLDMVMMAYDLCKYDTKMIFDNGEECFYNFTILGYLFKKHYRRYKQWERLHNRREKIEDNINISHNSNTTIKNQLKFIKDSYKLYNNNPYSHNIQKNIEQNIIIPEFEKDKTSMARAISAINNLEYDEKTFKDNITRNIIGAYHEVKHTLNSDYQVTKKDIVNSWLTYIAYRFNHSKMPKTKLAHFIRAIAKNTTIAYKDTTDEYIFTPEKLRTKEIREKISYYDLRLLEFKDERLQIKQSQDSIDTAQNYINNLNHYFSKHLNLSKS